MVIKLLPLISITGMDKVFKRDTSGHFRSVDKQVCLDLVNVGKQQPEVTFLG